MKKPMFFDYYAGRYPALKGTKGEIITIPIMDGSRSLDNHFIKPLLESGYEWKESVLLKEIYLIKRY